MKHRLSGIHALIEQTKNRLDQLDEERSMIIDLLGKLQQELSLIESSFPPAGETSELPPSAKISLFRSLFKGREDVYPKMWLSKDGARKGYMPACGNDGNYSLCGKRKLPRVKCADCNHQAYLPLTDEFIREHLQGKQTIGVYSKEELVAEMGAAFLWGHAGIESGTIENSAAYIQGWLKALKNDKTLLVHAAAQAQKAADYILNRKQEEAAE